MIGVTPLIDKERESYWMIPGYMQGIEAAGGVPVMLPLTSDPDEIARMADVCDGFLFTGGQDISPKRYGEQTFDFCGETAPERDAMEFALLDAVLPMDKACFGICRGIQLFNVYYGGSLYQDIPTQHPIGVNHHQSPPYDQTVHRVDITADTPLYDIIHRKSIFVNSYHHQGVSRQSSSLSVCAVSEDHIVEGLYDPNRKFVLAVQWHPEWLYEKDADNFALFEAFVREAGKS